MITTEDSEETLRLEVSMELDVEIGTELLLIGSELLLLLMKMELLLIEILGR